MPTPGGEAASVCLFSMMFLLCASRLSSYLRFIFFTRRHVSRDQRRSSMRFYVRVSCTWTFRVVIISWRYVSILNLKQWWLQAHCTISKTFFSTQFSTRKIQHFLRITTSAISWGKPPSSPQLSFYDMIKLKMVCKRFVKWRKLFNFGLFQQFDEVQGRWLKFKEGDWSSSCQVVGGLTMDIWINQGRWLHALLFLLLVVFFSWSDISERQKV